MMMMIIIITIIIIQYIIFIMSSSSIGSMAVCPGQPYLEKAMIKKEIPPPPEKKQTKKHKIKWNPFGVDSVNTIKTLLPD